MRVLLLSADSDLGSGLSERLGSEGHLLVTADHLAAAAARLRAERFDVIVTDVLNPALGGLELLRQARAEPHPTPVIAVGAPHSTAAERQALQEGAFDCARRPLEGELLLHRIKQARERERLRAELAAIRALLGSGNVRDDFVADGEAMRRLLAAASEVARRAGPALISGEPGSGKTALARAIHRLAAGAESPLLTIDCGVLSADVAARELVGSSNGMSPMTALIEHGPVLVESIDLLPYEVQQRLGDALGDGERPILATIRTEALTGNDKLHPGLRSHLEGAHLELPPPRAGCAGR